MRFGAWGLGLRVSYSESEVSWSESEVCLPSEDVGRREVVEETGVFVVVGGGHGYVQKGGLGLSQDSRSTSEISYV